MALKSKILPWDEVVDRDKVTIERICSDENFAYHFIYCACEPLLHKIAWTIFKNDVEFDELANELYIHLKAPDENGEYWHNLKTFDFRTSLFDWIKIVATRLFVKKNNEPLFIPHELIENGIISDIIFKLEKSLDRKMLIQYIIEGKNQEQVCENLNIDSQSFNSIVSCLIRKVRHLVKKYYPEYESLLYNKSDAIGPSLLIDESYNDIDTQIDLNILINRMPNERYKLVIQRLYVEDVPPEDLAIELNTPITNIYNLRLRAIDQLRDIAILSKDYFDINQHINSIIDDRLRSIATSLYIKGDKYDEIISTYNLSQSEFRQIKKRILYELKKSIYSK